MSPAKIIWTKVDEAPALATYALLPILQAYVKGTGVSSKHATSHLPAGSSRIFRTT